MREGQPGVPSVADFLAEHLPCGGTLGFDGLIVTDDLAMDAVKAYAQDGSAAVLSIQAGNDMVVTTDYREQIPQVIAAVRNGEIAESEIDAHVFRVLHEKQALGLID